LWGHHLKKPSSSPTNGFSLLKDKLRNRLSLHLDTIVRMFAHEFYIQENFPYEETITAWKD
jgi:hypothetical protein